MKTSDLTGITLDYAVGVALGHDMSKAINFGAYLRIPAHAGSAYTVTFCPSTDWTIGGPLIERERIQLTTIYQHDLKVDNEWGAYLDDGRDIIDSVMGGHTPLAAAMRCYVASRLGDEVSIPEELACEPSK
jgi:hypothetical protein